MTYDVASSSGGTKLRSSSLFWQRGEAQEQKPARRTGKEGIHWYIIEYIFFFYISPSVENSGQGR